MLEGDEGHIAHWRGPGSLAGTYSTLAEGRTGLANGELALRAIGPVAGHPATWGFYIGDDLPGGGSEPSAGARRDGTQPRPGQAQLCVARPGVARLKPFTRLANVAGADAYPIGSGDPPVRRTTRPAHAAASDAGAQTAMDHRRLR